MAPEVFREMANDSSANTLKKKKVIRLSSCGHGEWEGLVNETTSVVSLGFPGGKLGNLK